MRRTSAQDRRPTGRVIDGAAPHARRPPDQWQPHQPVDMERAFEQQSEVALQLAVVRREDHVDVVNPPRTR